MFMPKFTSRCLTYCIVAAFALVGCGGTKLPELGEVVGVVRHNGEPLSNVQILFEPLFEAGASYGFTNDVGEFEIMYRKGIPGAVPGKYRVQFVWRGLKDAVATPVNLSDVVIPPKFGIGGEGILVDVAVALNEFEFNLSEKQGK